MRDVGEKFAVEWSSYGRQKTGISFSVGHVDSRKPVYFLAVRVLLGNNVYFYRNKYEVRVGSCEKKRKKGKEKNRRERKGRRKVEEKGEERGEKRKTGQGLIKFREWFSCHGLSGRCVR